MQFGDLLQTLSADGDGWTLTVPEDWLQGRAVFGGLQAAVAAKVMRGLVPGGLPLRTLQTIFVAPGQSSTLRIRAEVLRTGKNTCHVEARLTEEGKVLAVVIGVFGAGRPSAVRRSLKQGAVESIAPVPLRFRPGIVPNFIQHFEARWLRGTPPFGGGTLPEAVVELALNDGGPTSELHVLALADFIPPVAFGLLKAPTSGSSLTWMIEFLADDVAHLPLAGWRVDAEMVAAQDGYTSQSVTLWGPGGEAVALSRQSMVVFG